jgi:VWFA-related protein
MRSPVPRFLRPSPAGAVRLCFVTVVAALVAFLPHPAAQTRFTARVDIVRVDALVTERGRPVLGLTPDDFEVRDNGVVQQVDFVGSDDVPVNAILTLDMSDSVEGDRLTHLREAGGALLDALRPGDRVALVGFSHMVTLGSQLTDDVAGVRAALETSQPKGNTSLIDAAYAGLVLSESDTGRAVMIAFSDGLDTASWLTADQVLDTGRRTNAVVYGVSVEAQKKQTFLADLSEVTGGSTFKVESTKDLGALFVRVLDEFRQRYLLSYTPQGVSKAGFHKLDVRVKGRSVKITARPGYLAGS